MNKLLPVIQNSNHLLDLRRLASNSHELRQMLADRSLHRISNQHAIASQYWQQLRPFERSALQVLCIGRELRSGCLIGRSAAVLHGLWTLPSAAPVEVTLGNGHRRPRKDWPDGVHYYKQHLPADAIVEICGVRVTKPAMTCVDIAKRWGFSHGLAAMDSYLAHGGHASALAQEVRRAVRSRGIAHARQALRWAHSAMESPYESLFRAQLIESLPHLRWEAQAQIGHYRADFLIEGRLIVEIDGAIKYQERPAEAIRAERQREKWLLQQGYTVVRFSPQELNQNPQRCLDAVLRLLGMN